MADPQNDIEAQGAGKANEDTNAAQVSQDMKLVICTVDRTIEIPLKGNMILQNSGQGPRTTSDDDDKEYLRDMRGWIVTVAALFVGMAFQAAMQPPAWMPKTEIWSLMLTFWHRRDRALSPDARMLAMRAARYQLLNAITFSAALSLMTLLLMMKKSSSLLPVKLLIPLLSFCVASNFIVGITHDGVATGLITIFSIEGAFLAVGWIGPTALRLLRKIPGKKQGDQNHPAVTAESGGHNASGSRRAGQDASV